MGRVSSDKSQENPGQSDAAAESGTAVPQAGTGGEPRIAQPLVAADEQGIGADVPDALAHDRKSAVIHHDFKKLASTSWRFIVIVAAIALIGYVLKFVWAGILPVILAILVSTVLYPVTAWMRTKWRFPAALAAATTLIGFFAIVGGIFTAMAPTVKEQSGQLFSQAEEGINTLVGMTDQLPFNVDQAQIQSVADDVTNLIKNQASNIAGGVLSGVSTVSSIVVTLVIMLFLTFFFIKEGEKFLPWLRKYVGHSTGWHITELSNRIWKTLSGFIQAQATVAFVDAVLIGAGLWIMGVPLAFVIGVVTFFASFIPVIGAVTAGVLAVAVALVSQGFTSAIIALIIVVAVQQIEGNVLQPLLQSKAMGLHAAIILLSVTVGSGLAGIIGAFLAVPVAATIGVIFRYNALVTSIRSGEVDPAAAEIVTGAPKPDKKSKKKDATKAEDAVASEQAANDNATDSSPDMDAARDIERLAPDSPRAKVRELYLAMAPSTY